MFDVKYAFSVLCFLLALGSLHAQSMDEARLLDQAESSVVKIDISGKDTLENATSFHGSGFVAFSNENLSLIVTAAHVVGPRSSWSLDESGGPKFKITISRQVDDRYELLTDEAAVFGDQVVKTASNDWEIIVVNRGNLPTLPISHSFPVEFGVDVLLLGFPGDSRDLTPLIGKAQEFDSVQYGVRQPFAFIGGQPDKGHSGSPIIDADGAVIAIASENYRKGNRYIHLGVFASFFAKTVSEILGSRVVPEFQIKKCVSSKLDGQIARPFSQMGAVRCPGGGCLFQSGSCNRRETRLNYASPTGYVIDQYEFRQESLNHGVSGNLRVHQDDKGRVREISVSLLCDPSDGPGAPGGWNVGRLDGTLQIVDIDKLRYRAEQECRIELAR